MSVEGFIRHIDAEIDSLEKEIKSVTVQKTRESIQSRIDELRVLRSRAEPWAKEKVQA